VKNIESLTDVV